jgi:hypothetical protein
MQTRRVRGAVRAVADVPRGTIGNPNRWVPAYALSVFLTPAGDPFHAPGPSDGLWRLAPLKENRSGILPKRFSIGSVPEGWKEAVPLQGDLAPDVEYRIYVSSREAYIVRLDFSLGDLRPGYILDFNGNLVPTRRFPLRTTCTEAT